MSTDNSVEIANSLGCKVIPWNTGNKIDDNKLRDLKNNCWKSVNKGWIIMADMDEWLCTTELQLIEEDKKGVTILKTKGFNMLGDSNSVLLDDIDLHSINLANFSIDYSKKVCFKRTAINEINFEYGAHNCNPVGSIKYSKHEYIIKHMCYMGLPYLIEKMKMKFKRSQEMQKIGLAVHYTDNEQVITSRYNHIKESCIILNPIRFYNMQDIKSFPKKILKFIHITKTAGTSIEKVGLKHNHKWGMYHEQEYGWWHQIFTKKSKELRNKYDWFTVVRNPYTRILSEIHYIHKKLKTVDEFNTIIKKEINYLLSNHNDSNHPYQRPGGDHFTEQYKYIDPNSVIHILHFETVKEEFEELMNVYNYNNVRLNMVEYKTEKKISVKDISKENIELINIAYKEDFEKFGYGLLDYDTIQNSGNLDSLLTKYNDKNKIELKSEYESECESESDSEHQPENKINNIVSKTIDDYLDQNESKINIDNFVPSLKTKQPLKDLRFIHISRTAGTSIEQIGLDNQKFWGRYHRGYGQYDEIFARKVDFIKRSHDWFTVVRNPYTRILSDYKFLSIILKIKESDNVSTFNQFIKNWITNIESNTENHHIYGKTTGGHFTPQYKYIDKSCTIHILKYENIEEEFNTLMTKYNLEIVLNKKVNITNTKLSIFDINKENVELIKRVYKLDFEQFGYSYDMSITNNSIIKSHKQNLSESPESPQSPELPKIKESEIKESEIKESEIKESTLISKKKAIVFLCIKPSDHLIKVAKSLQNNEYSIFICVDDNNYNKTLENINIIQYSNDKCNQQGYNNSSFIIKPNGSIAWDKALYHFCVKEKNYEHVWFIEDDVFIPNNTIISTIDSKYPNPDILSKSKIINSTGELSWHWNQAQGKLPLPWMRSLVPAIRLSRSVLSLVNRYVNKNKKLLFVEFMFHTLAMHKKLDIEAIPELEGIFYRKKWSFMNIKQTSLYHPVKNINQLKYRFIHPTKTGGTAIEKFFENNYSLYIHGKHHTEICKNYDNPIIIIRCPIDRFISMFNYWKNGSVDSKYKRPLSFIDEYKNYSIKDFITLIKQKQNEKLYVDFTTDLHFSSMNYWISENDYNKTIVIKYHNDLNTKIPDLLQKLNIPDKKISLEKFNVSIKEIIELDEEDKIFLKKRFAYDFKLWDTIHNNPNLFKAII